MPEMEVKEVFSTPICARKQNGGPPGIDQGFSTASCNSHHACTVTLWVTSTHPPPFLPPFLLVQNLSSKQIARTDNMWPNSSSAVKIKGPAGESHSLCLYLYDWFRWGGASSSTLTVRSSQTLLWVHTCQWQTSCQHFMD